MTDHIDKLTVAFLAQYQQRSVSVEGNIVKWKRFQIYQHELGHNGARIVLSFDATSKAGELNDYSVWRK